MSHTGKGYRQLPVIRTPGSRLPGKIAKTSPWDFGRLFNMLESTRTFALVPSILRNIAPNSVSLACGWRDSR